MSVFLDFTAILHRFRTLLLVAQLSCAKGQRSHCCLGESCKRV